MHVLIVDDSRANRMVLQRLLTSFAYKTVEVENGPEAIWMLRRTTDFGLIVVDYHMPKMSGVQLVRWIRKEEALAQVPILMISGDRSPKLKEEAFEAGVTAFLEKPFDREIIENKLIEMGIDTKVAPATHEPTEDEKLRAELKAMGIDLDAV
jgi:CheY-like chemotaxis protein